MRETVRHATCITLLLAANAALACDYPAQAPAVPNGSTATQDEMIEGQKGVKKYVADIEAYLECIVAEDKAARAELEDLKPEDEQQREDTLTKKYNAAVDEMEKVAARFNVEVQAYKNRDN
ncbi:MAG: hypothetical protein ACREQ1_10615 [Woeseiaceae bacterium]